MLESEPAGLPAVAALLRRESRIAPGLHVVATPIGNLADITLRALAVLAAADIVACEDTRVTRKLAEHFGLRPRLVSYHAHNEASRTEDLLAELDSGRIVALVSDAGTPLLSDPGHRLVTAAIAAGHPVTAEPGPSALLAALATAGLPADRFWFEGFLPPKAGARRARLAFLAGLEATAVVYESPRRIAATLAELSPLVAPGRAAVVARELTKRFEELRRGSVAELAAAFATEPPPKGEIVLVLGPAEAEAARDDADVDARLASLVAAHGVREAATLLAAETGLKRRDLYARALALAGKERT